MRDRCEVCQCWNIGGNLSYEKFGWPTAILFLAPAEGWKGPSGPVVGQTTASLSPPSVRPRAMQTVLETYTVTGRPESGQWKEHDTDL